MEHGSSHCYPSSHLSFTFDGALSLDVCLQAPLAQAPTGQANSGAQPAHQPITTDDLLADDHDEAVEGDQQLPAAASLRAPSPAQHADLHAADADVARGDRDDNHNFSQLHAEHADDVDIANHPVASMRAEPEEEDQQVPPVGQVQTTAVAAGNISAGGPAATSDVAGHKGRGAGQAHAGRGGHNHRGGNMGRGGTTGKAPAKTKVGHAEMVLVLLFAVKDTWCLCWRQVGCNALHIGYHSLSGNAACYGHLGGAPLRFT